MIGRGYARYWIVTEAAVIVDFAVAAVDFVAVSVVVVVVVVVAVVFVIFVVANGIGRLFDPVQTDYKEFWPGSAHNAAHPEHYETDPNYRGVLESSCGDHPKVPRENLKYNGS